LAGNVSRRSAIHYASHWWGCHLVIFESGLSSRQGTKAKQKGIIYEGLLKVPGDKENPDIMKN
jgi:hypothetical protein